MAGRGLVPLVSRMHGKRRMWVRTALGLLAALAAANLGCAGGSSNGKTPDGGGAPSGDAPAADAPGADAGVPPDGAIAETAADLPPDARCPASPPTGQCTHDATGCYYSDGRCYTNCGCTFIREWSCVRTCPEQLVCPPAPPIRGSQCGATRRCTWSTGCAPAECTCMQFEIGSPFNWYCQPLPHPDGGAVACDGGVPADR